MLFHKLYGIFKTLNIYQFSSQLLAKIYKINKLKELKVLVINQGNFKVPDNFILNNLELISTEKELFFSPNELPFSQGYTMQV